VNNTLRLKFNFFHRRQPSRPFSSDNKQQEDEQQQEPQEEHSLIIYESVPMYDSETNEFVGKVQLPTKFKVMS
jgi:hypothetical protein